METWDPSPSRTPLRACTITRKDLGESSTCELSMASSVERCLAGVERGPKCPRVCSSEGHPLKKTTILIGWPSLCKSIVCPGMFHEQLTRLMALEYPPSHPGQAAGSPQSLKAPDILQIHLRRIRHSPRHGPLHGMRPRVHRSHRAPRPYP